jgi:hypothetical protein
VFITSGALVLYDQYRDDAGWVRYLALHRQGGLEVGLGHLTHPIRRMTGDTRVFPLGSIVAVAWTLAALRAATRRHLAPAAPSPWTRGARSRLGVLMGPISGQPV